MIDVKRVLTNLTSVTTGEMVSRAIGLLLYIAIARYLGPVDFGRYSLALTYCVIFCIFADFGLDTPLVRAVARNRDEASRYFCTAVVLKVCFCFRNELEQILVGSGKVSTELRNLFDCKVRSTCEGCDSVDDFQSFYDLSKAKEISGCGRLHVKGK